MAGELKFLGLGVVRQRMRSQGSNSPGGFEDVVMTVIKQRLYLNPDLKQPLASVRKLQHPCNNT